MSVEVAEESQPKYSDRLATLSLISGLFGVVAGLGLPIALVAGIRALRRNRFEVPQRRIHAILGILLAPLGFVLFIALVASAPSTEKTADTEITPSASQSTIFDASPSPVSEPSLEDNPNLVSTLATKAKEFYDANYGASDPFYSYVTSIFVENGVLQLYTSLGVDREMGRKLCSLGSAWAYGAPEAIDAGIWGVSVRSSMGTEIGKRLNFASQCE